MKSFRITFWGESNFCSWQSHEFKAKSPKKAWKKALKEWGGIAKSNRNSSVNTSFDFLGGKLDAELIEIHRREKGAI